jgi:hypothetical protein
MERQPVESSLLLTVGYDAEAKVMEVEFKRTPGVVYRYSDVLPEEASSMLGSKSIGSYFLKKIKPNRTCTKIAPEKTNAEDTAQAQAE